MPATKPKTRVPKLKRKIRITKKKSHTITWEILILLILVLGVIFAVIFAQHRQAYIDQASTPSPALQLNCLAATCPSVSGQAPSGASVTSGGSNISAPPASSETVSPPCSGPAAVHGLASAPLHSEYTAYVHFRKYRSSGSYSNYSRGGRSGIMQFFQQLLQFILQILQKLIQLLGGGGNIGGAGAAPSGAPSASNPCSSSQASMSSGAPSGPASAVSSAPGTSSAPGASSEPGTLSAPAPAGGGSGTSSCLSGSSTLAIDNGLYTMEANEYSSSAQFQICGNGTLGGFTVSQSQINGSLSSAPGAYPAVYKGNHWGHTTTNSGLPVSVTDLEKGNVVTSTVSTTTVNSGDWDDSYDTFFDSSQTGNQSSGGAIEMMIWQSHYGSIQPAGSQVATKVSVDGGTYDVWWSGYTLSYVSDPVVTSATIDFGPFAKDAVTRGYITASDYFIDVEHGFEIWSGGQGLVQNSLKICTPSGC